MTVATLLLCARGASANSDPAVEASTARPPVVDEPVAPGGGGGGCSCEMRAASPLGAGVAVLAAGLAMLRRRRR